MKSIYGLPSDRLCRRALFERNTSGRGRENEWRMRTRVMYVMRYVTNDRGGTIRREVWALVVLDVHQRLWNAECFG